jgi:tRNA-splicing ligase RtcB
MTELKKINDYEWEIPKTGKMNVPGKIFASKKLIEKIKQDLTLQQVQNVAMLPGILKASIAMPDAHQGYGASIGAVAAFPASTGIVSPGMCGFDINCGIRILSTDIPFSEFLKKRKQVLHDIYRTIPSGVGRGRKERLSFEQLEEVLKKGVEWAVENGYGKKEDMERCEEHGKMEGANPDNVSKRAKQRGLPQLGTLGAGNHFLEIQKVEEIFDEQIAEIFGLSKDNIVVAIHCGSRGLGHQVASDYMKAMEEEYGFENLPDRELINAPINSRLGKEYFSAMKCAVNYAFCNRQLIMHDVRNVLEKHFPGNKNHLIYDVAHNITKIEKHIIDGKEKEVIVIRKGATRSFGPGRKEIPKIYREVGQPVIIPGSMGTSSYVLAGTKKAEEISWGSTAHGAGRVMSRHEALRQFRGEKIKQELKDKDIEIEAGGWKGIAEEAPGVYKNIDEVVKVSHEAGIGNLVAKMKPLAVMKG